MDTHILVCPFDEHLLSRLCRKAIAVRLKDLEQIGLVQGMAQSFENHIHCVLISLPIPLAEVPFRKEWQPLPLALYAQQLGSFKNLATKLHLVRKMNLRIFLPADLKENLTSVRVLSSLGIATTLVFDKSKAPNWESLADLMVYALLNRVTHGPVEPFHFIATRFRRNERTDFSAVYFDDPLRYLHVDEHGRVALSHHELLSGRFIAEDVSQIEEIVCSEAYGDRLESWRECFLDQDGCACCEGWRVCQGKFFSSLENHDGCRRFSVELLKTVEQCLNIRKQKREVWQP